MFFGAFSENCLCYTHLSHCLSRGEAPANHHLQALLCFGATPGLTDTGFTMNHTPRTDPKGLWVEKNEIIRPRPLLCRDSLPFPLSHCSLFLGLNTGAPWEKTAEKQYSFFPESSLPAGARSRCPASLLPSRGPIGRGVHVHPGAMCEKLPVGQRKERFSFLSFAVFSTLPSYTFLWVSLLPNLLSNHCFSR